MRERPILFSGPMVRAILSGAKSMTRRVVNPRLHFTNGDDVITQSDAEFGLFASEWLEVCPYGQPSDMLWVRETFYCDHCEYPKGPPDEMVGMLDYRADHDCRNWEAGCPCRDDSGRSSWRPSIHMPRWAARITLEVTDVRVERLQQISEDDARAEGVNPIEINPEQPVIGVGYTFGQRPYSAAFACLWDEINDERAPWSSNPWVWCVSFERVTP